MLVMREALWQATVGIGIGLVTTFAASRLISNRLFGLAPNDPTTFVLSGVLLVAVSMLVGYLPARRAAKINPTVALRYE